MKPTKVWAVPVALALVAGRAEAHDPFEITTEARLGAEAMVLHVAMAASTAAAACLPDRPGRPGRVEEASFASLRPALEACGRGLYAVSAGGRALAPAHVAVALGVEGDVTMQVTYPRPPPGPLGFRATFLGHLRDPGYGAVLTVTGQGEFLGQQLLRAEEPTLTVIPGAGVPGAPPEATRPPPLPSPGRYFALGVRHILTGADHLLFLLGLLIGCRRLRTVLGVVTCFSLAHSLTLALAALDLISVSPRVTEPVIAATIAFVGVENLVRGEAPRGRLPLAFVFGLVHGLGFAGALRDTGLGARGGPLVLPLVSFNLGVEVGQMAVAVPALWLLWRLHASARFSRSGARIASALVAAVGVYWLVTRVMA